MNETALFNPFEFEDVDSAIVQLRDPISGELTKACITLMGPVHPQRRQIDFAIAKRESVRLVEAMRKGRNAVNQVDPEEEFENQTERLAKYTLGWSGLSGEDGKPLEFSLAAARKLYATPKLSWLRDQIKVAADETERFIKRSAASS